MLLGAKLICILSSVLSISSHINTVSVRAEDPWSFVVFADWHGGEGFSFNPDKTTTNYQQKLAAFRYIKENYGGDLAVLPGDTQSGMWHELKYQKKHYPQISNFKNVVYTAGTNCYTTIKELFSDAGYDKILVSTGDHEYGGNGWGSIIKDRKTKANIDFRNSFGDGFNKDPNSGELIFSDPIGNAPSVPYGTPFESTSYAYRYKNVLFITVDAFTMVGDGSKVFYRRKQGLGGEGVITCTLDGDHLEWFENVLIEANKDASILHIIVQAHLPMIQPVRKVNCSGQFMDSGEKSKFWQTMKKYNVDLYLAGEVHANTATKDPESNLVQVVTRANRLNNFMRVNVTDNVLILQSFNEIGEKENYNNNHILHGELIVDKSGSETVFNSSGSLELLDRVSPLLSFKFDAIHPINERQVLGLKNKDKPDELIASSMIIRGKTSYEAIWNTGSFKEQYDMQVFGLTLVPGIRDYAAKFDSNSRAAIFGIGPHGPGNTISYAMWFKTSTEGLNMILLHFGFSFGNLKNLCKKDQFTLTLDQGVPTLYRCFLSKLIPLNKKDFVLNDGKWHHIAVSMPYNNCPLSRVVMYIDGVKVDTTVEGSDASLFFSTSGRVSIGGFGYSLSAYDNVFSDHSTFTGLIDEVQVFGRGLWQNDISRLTSIRTFSKYEGYKCSFSKNAMLSKTTVYSQYMCPKSCQNDIQCQGFEMERVDINLNKYRCIIFNTAPSLGVQDDMITCGVGP